jgi:hypothetical protein
MTSPSVVLVDQSTEPLSPALLAHVARAFQTQIDRDFSAAWGARARITAAGGSRAPEAVWPLYLLDPAGARPGVHLDAGGEPFAEVAAGEGWTVAASHALMEMIADPHGDRLMPGPPADGRARRCLLRYLVEVCAPCQSFHYVIDGVEVSDFVTPDYYRADGTALDFLRLLRRPLEVRPGCSLSWQDPRDGHWHQHRPDGTVRRSGEPSDPLRNPREDRDRVFPPEPSPRRRRRAGRVLA